MSLISKNNRLVQHSENDIGVMKPQLTSLIDVMTILLVFLLKSFSADNSIVTIPENMTLAESIQKNKIENSYTVSITRDIILYEGRKVVNLSIVKDQTDKMIHPLHAVIEKGTSGQGYKVIVQADKSVPFSVIKKVLYTCSQAGFKGYSLLVEVES